MSALQKCEAKVLMFNLRPYQSEAVVRVREAYKAGKRRVIVSLPTGTGKTVVFAHFPSALKMKKRLLVLAHREELLRQAGDKFRFLDPELKVGIEQAGYTGNSWYAVPGGYRLSLPDGESLLVESNLLDTWDITHVTLRDGATLLDHAESLADAIPIADRYLSAERPDAVRLVARDARWRTEPPTDKQKQLLVRKSIAVPEGLTRGQAAQMISLVLASSRR